MGIHLCFFLRKFPVQNKQEKRNSYFIWLATIYIDPILCIRYCKFFLYFQIVGNLLYYRYINSAIVAPDAFDIINVEADKQLSNDQRRNLGSVAKILQFAASNKGVSESHM